MVDKRARGNSRESSVEVHKTARGQVRRVAANVLKLKGKAGSVTKRKKKEKKTESTPIPSLHLNSDLLTHLDFFRPTRPRQS
jgi:hypothetical protein